MNLVFDIFLYTCPVAYSADCLTAVTQGFSLLLIPCTVLSKIAGYPPFKSRFIVK